MPAMQEPEHGRARVVSQDGDRPDAQEEAADLCPVECIHRVPAQQLDRLEHALTLCEREDAATLADRYGSQWLPSAAGSCMAGRQARI